MFRAMLVFFLLITLSNCSQKTIYSGKILNQEKLNDINFKNKEILLSKMGVPSYVDPIENKYFYYSEKKTKRTAFDEKLEYSYIFVFEFDNQDNISNSKVYNLKNRENIDIVKDEIDNEVVKRGLLEKIFGGVGTQQELPNTQ